MTTALILARRLASTTSEIEDYLSERGWRRRSWGPDGSNWLNEEIHASHAYPVSAAIALQSGIEAMADIDDLEED